MNSINKSLRDNYNGCWKFFLESQWFFVFAFAIFGITFLIGFIFPVFFREEIFEKIASLILEIEGKGALELIGFIFLNNLMVSFMAIVLGIFFGIFPLMTCVVNGYLLGFVAREAAVRDGVLVLWKILPHGVFELPAVIFSIGIGIRIGVSIVGSKWAGGKDMGYVLREGLRFFVFVVFPLLLLAGIIEGILIAISA
jgi:stage II sporulation protein M